ncbi:MAG: hypothetical protein R3264_05645 [Anaerolineae bacterium]|nr:hypothetical protein [Anaerolineae bacterium]
MNNTIVVVHYFTYILISAGLTVWVGKTLFSNGRVFLVDSFKGKTAMADSVNHLLLVGFYLVNFGLVSLFLKYGAKPTDLVEFIELLSTKVGLVLLLLGLMHFFNIVVFKLFNRFVSPSEPAPRRAAVPAA